MDTLRIWLKRFLGIFQPSRREGELSAELQAHLDLLVAENIRRGMTSDEARYAARRAFGGLEQTKEAYRHQRGLPFFDALAQDLRFAFRGLAKNPTFAVVAILILGLGIGATTAVFSVVDRILFRSLPYPHDDRLVSFGDLSPFDTNEFVLGPDYFDWKHQNTPFESMTSFVPGGADCDLTEQNPARLKCAMVEASFLPTFGIQPLLGRNFSRDEDRPNAARVALISYGLWRSRFAADANLPGKTISLDGRPSVVVGILPAEFEMPNMTHPDLLLPAALPESNERGSNAQLRVLRAFARLKPGVSIPQARAAMQPLFDQSLNYVPPQFRHEVSFRLRSLRDRQIADARLASWVLLASVLAVLLVACTNVANLLLARATGRQRELAVRTALGASKVRLARQALTESLLFGVSGGFLGCGFAYALLRIFVSIAPDGVPRLNEAALDGRVLLFTFAISLASGILFGLAPALRYPSAELLSGKERAGDSHGFLRQVLVTAQIGISLVLVSGAGLLLRSLWNLQNVSLGLDANRVVTAEVDLTEYRYPDATRQLAFFDQLERRLQQMPGITSLAISDTLPPSGGMQSTFLSTLEIPGHAKYAGGTGGMIGFRYVTPDYFRVLRVRIVRGRGFREQDRGPSETPVILNEALARKLFRDGEDPIGKLFRFRNQNQWRTIVGIAADVKNNGLAATADPEFYLPWKNDAGGYFRIAHVLLQSAIDSRTVNHWLHSEIASIDPNVPITVEMMSSRVGKLTDRPRFNAVLLSIFAGLGVLLAAVGIYGLVGFLVGQQTREIGVRMALGATPQSILKMVLVGIARWALAGAAAGLLGAWLCEHMLESLLFEERARDPLLLGLSVLLLIVVAFVAAWIPARRAMRVDPLVALRYE
jgi:putative ABC transport system permease protein